MQNVSNQYKELITSSGRQFVAKIYTNIELSDEQRKTGLYSFNELNNNLIISNDNIMMGSLTITDETTEQGSFGIGGAIINKLKFEVENFNGRFNEIDFAEAEFDVRIGLITAQDYEGNLTIEWVKKGIYTTEEIVNNDNYVTVTAFDNLAKLDRPYNESNLKYPATLAAILDDACTRCGVVVDSLDFPNASWKVSNRQHIDDSATFRDVVSWVSQLACSFAKCDADGRLHIKWYESTETEINESRTISGGVAVTGVSVVNAADEELNFMTGEEGYVLHIEGNPLAQINSHSTNNPMWDSVWADRLLGFRITPFESAEISNPAIEAGDIVTVYDKHGNAYRTPVTGLTYKLDSKTNLRCDAETAEEKNRSGGNQTAKIKAIAKQEAEKKISAYDVYAQNFNGLMANSMGFYETSVPQDDGTKIVYQHDKPTIEESKYIWKKGIDGFAVSSDGCKTWGAGFDKNGNAVLNVLAAHGVVADWIKTGVIRGAENTNAYFDLDNDELSCTKMSGSNSGYYFKLDKVVYSGAPYYSGMYAYSKENNSLQGGIFNLEEKYMGLLGVNGVSIRSNALNSTLCNEFKMTNDSSGKGEISLTRLTGYTDVTTERVMRIDDTKLYLAKYFNSAANATNNCYIHMYQDGGTTGTRLEIGVRYPYSGSSQERTNFIRIGYNTIEFYVAGRKVAGWPS